MRQKTRDNRRPPGSKELVPDGGRHDGERLRSEASGGRRGRGGGEGNGRLRERVSQLVTREEGVAGDPLESDLDVPGR